jgi:hypothetical protein
MSAFIVPSLLPLPKLPKKGVTKAATIENLLKWAEQMASVIQRANMQIAYRLEEMPMQGTLAERPDANGRKRFYYATDTDDLHYDDGIWNLVGGTDFGGLWETDIDGNLQPTADAHTDAWWEVVADELVPKAA